jgi:hypothetical protein
VTVNRFFQTGWVVTDLDEAIKHWSSVNGVGPFVVRRGVSSPGIEYRGVVTPLVVDIAHAQAGDIQIELIRQLNDDPSAYRDVYGADGSGLHHVGAFTEDFDADMQHYKDAGVAVVEYGVSGTTRFAYFDTRDSTGCMTELIDQRSSAQLQELYAQITKASLNWDGVDPILKL